MDNRRRKFSKLVLNSITSYTLLRAIIANNALSNSVKPVIHNWLNKLVEMSKDLKFKEITALQWQSQIKYLYDKVTLHELLTYTDFEQLSKQFLYPERGVNTKKLQLPNISHGLNKNIIGKVFGMKKGRAIIPHGHKNMVSCHYVLQGKFHLKTYDKLKEDSSYMIIEPTIDEVVTTGSHSSISDYKNNVHWLKALSKTAFTFDIIILQTNNDNKIEINNIDPNSAEKLAGGKLRAMKLPVGEALQKYG